MAAGGTLLFAPIELALTVWTYSQPLRWGGAPNLVLLVVLLAAMLWLMLAAATAATLLVRRIVRSLIDGAPDRSAGWFVARDGARGVRPGVPGMWASIVTALV